MASETQPTERASNPQRLRVMARRAPLARMRGAWLAGVCLAVAGAVGLGPPLSPALAQSAASVSTADADMRMAQAGILHLTGLLSQARRSLDGTVGAHRAALEQAIATLSEARTRYALALRDLTAAQGVSAARVSEDLRAAEALSQQGERLLAQARTAALPAAAPAVSPTQTPSVPAPSVAAPAAPRPAPTATAGAETGRDHLPAPAIPSLAASGAPAQPQPFQTRPQVPPSPAPSAASAQTPAPLLPQAAPPQTAAVAVPARPAPQGAPQDMPQPAPQPRPAASLPPPDVPEPPGTVTFKANDAAPPAGGEAGSSAALAAEVAGTLPERLPVQMTGEAALPPPGGATGPFRAGGPADWTPDRTPVPRPQGDASVRVDTAQAPPQTPYPPATARAEAVPSQPSSLAPPQMPAAPQVAPPQVAAAPSAPYAPASVVASAAPGPAAPVRVEPPGVPAPPPGTSTLDPGLTVPPPSLTDPRQIAQVPATPDPTPQVDRPTLPDERLVAYAQNYPLRRRSLQLPPPGAPLPRPQPGLALERPPGLAPTEPPAGPPQAPGPGMAPSAVPSAAPDPAGTAPAVASAATAPPARPPQSIAAADPPPPPASGAAAATPARTTPADRLLSDESRDQFAEIRSQVGAQQQQAREILRQIDPVRTDLTRRMNGLPEEDPRRGGMAQVRDMINGAEVELKAALDGYGALLRQLDFVLEDKEGGQPSGWTPTDAARQAIAASKRANAGVNGLKTAMARFEQVMTQSQ